MQGTAPPTFADEWTQYSINFLTRWLQTRTQTSICFFVIIIRPSYSHVYSLWAVISGWRYNFGTVCLSISHLHLLFQCFIVTLKLIFYVESGSSNMYGQKTNKTNCHHYILTSEMWFSFYGLLRCYECSNWLHSPTWPCQRPTLINTTER